MIYNVVIFDCIVKLLLLFMYFNMGYEYIGKWMGNMDVNMVKFLINMVVYFDILIMIFFDYGNKNIQYSYIFEEGMREVFDLVFFMIVFDGVVERFGLQWLFVLVLN